MGELLNLPVTFETTGACPTCGIEWAMPSNYVRVKRDEKSTFHCPNGHPQSFMESEADKLRKELEAERRRTAGAQADAVWQSERRASAEREASAARGQATKARNQLAAVKERVSNGVCPCCHRTFLNLQRHMGTKHPDYKNEGGES